VSGVGDESGASDAVGTAYAIRITPRALAEIDRATDRFEGFVGEEMAHAWRVGVRQQVRTLSSHPRQHPIVAEQQYFSEEVRQVLYRRTSSSAAYRLLFRIDDSGRDGPLVVVFHVRHAAAKPIGRKEARELRSSE
jgi:plasmid stabilization system protein ParE